jgi:hypothetical protein
MNDKLLVQVGQQWVPKSRTKLTRTLWYTLGTAHEFEKNRPQECRASIEMAKRIGSEKWVSNPRGHPHRALDQSWSSSCMTKSWRRRKSWKS